MAAAQPERCLIKSVAKLLHKLHKSGLHCLPQNLQPFGGANYLRTFPQVRLRQCSVSSGTFASRQIEGPHLLLHIDETFGVFTDFVPEWQTLLSEVSNLLSTYWFQAVFSCEQPVVIRCWLLCPAVHRTLIFHTRKEKSWLQVTARVASGENATHWTAIRMNQKSEVGCMASEFQETQMDKHRCRAGGDCAKCGWEEVVVARVQRPHSGAYGPSGPSSFLRP